MAQMGTLYNQLEWVDGWHATKKISNFIFLFCKSTFLPSLDLSTELPFLPLLRLLVGDHRVLTCPLSFSPAPDMDRWVVTLLPRIWTNPPLRSEFGVGIEEEEEDESYIGSPVGDEVGARPPPRSRSTWVEKVTNEGALQIWEQG
jgi:hypothetical protein